MKFMLRDIFSVILVTGLMLGWYLDHSQLARENRFLEDLRNSSPEGLRAAAYEEFFQEEGYTVTRDRGSVSIQGANGSITVHADGVGIP